jgi:hypothetical protein
MMRPWKQGEEFLHRCRAGVLQYVTLQSLGAVLAFVLQRSGVYHEGSMSPTHGYLYLAMMKNVSQCWALYHLRTHKYGGHIP